MNIKTMIYELEEVIKRKEQRLKLFKYDHETSAAIQKSIDEYNFIIGCLKKELPAEKIHEYGGEYRCSKCGQLVYKATEYCQNCGQKLEIGSYHKGEDGIPCWNAEK